MQHEAGQHDDAELTQATPATATQRPSAPSPYLMMMRSPFVSRWLEPGDNEVSTVAILGYN